METFPASLALCAGNSPVTGEFASQRPVTRNFDVFFDLRLNKRLNKQLVIWDIRWTIFLCTYMFIWIETNTLCYHVNSQVKSIFCILHVNLYDHLKFWKVWFMKNNLWNAFYWHWISSISAWMINDILNTVLEEITYPFSNFKNCTVEVWKWISDFILHIIFNVITDPY